MHRRVAHHLAAAAAELDADLRVRAHSLQDRRDPPLQVAARVADAGAVVDEVDALDLPDRDDSRSRRNFLTICAEHRAEQRGE